jgi:hypothetical protein
MFRAQSNWLYKGSNLTLKFGLQIKCQFVSVVLVILPFLLVLLQLV